MLALIAFVELDVTLTAVAIGVSLRARSRAATFGATAVGAAATALALGSAWLVWFVAPSCLGDPALIACIASRAGAGPFLVVAELALVQWAWMVGVALFARSLPARAGARG